MCEVPRFASVILSRIENEMLPIPFLVKAGYSPLKQPGSITQNSISSVESNMRSSDNIKSIVSPCISRKRRRFSNEEDLALIHGLKRFKDQKNIFAYICNYYAIFSGLNGQGTRTGTQLKDRFRILAKHRDKRMEFNESGDYLGIVNVTRDDEPESITKMCIRLGINIDGGQDGE